MFRMLVEKGYMSKPVWHGVVKGLMRSEEVRLKEVAIV